MKKIFTLLNILFLVLHVGKAQPVLVKNISAGATNFIALGDIVFFTSNDSLFKSDGTPGGTVFIENGLERPGNFFINGGLVYFMIHQTPPGSPYPNQFLELWRTDGTAPGTFGIGHSDVPGVHVFATIGNKVFFSVENASTGREPWVTDGSASGTFELKNINPGFGDGSLSGVVNNGYAFGETVGSEVFFPALQSGIGNELWKSNGTTTGTVLVKDINAGAANGIIPGERRAAATSTHVYFIANEGVNGPELWKSDGTTAGTVLVKDIVPGTGSSHSFTDGSNYHTLFTPTFITEAGNTIYFIAQTINSTTGDFTTLYKSDGTAAGTVSVKDIPVDNIISLFEFQNKLYIVGSAGIDQQLWISDGTSSGTIMLKDQLRGGDNYLGDFNAVGSQLVFTDNIQGFAYQLWKTDGTIAGTQLIRNMNSAPGDFEVVNDILFFTEHGAETFFESGDGINDFELWQSDLTTEGTFMVKTIADVSFAGSDNLTDVNGILYFTTQQPVSGIAVSKKLWKYEPYEFVAHALTLVNAATDSDIRDLNVSDTVYTDQQVNIRAKVSGDVESVRFFVNDVLVRTENTAPYALAGDNNGNFSEWVKSPGFYKIEAIAFSGNNGTGIQGNTITRYVRVLLPGDTVNTITFMLVNASSNSDIRELNTYDTIIFNPSVTQLTVRAIPSLGAGSVVFLLNGSVFRSENLAPYSLTGDTGGDYNPWSVSEGEYNLHVNVYSGASGSGTLLQSRTIHLTVIHSSPSLKVAASPNPASDKTLVSIQSESNSSIQLILYDAMGKAFAVENHALVKGENEITLNLDSYNLSTGLYYLKLRQDQEESMIKIYKE